jgi:hypothetical protein
LTPPLSSGPILRLGPDLLPIPEAIGCVDTADADIHHGDAPSALIPLGEVERLHIEGVLSHTGGVVEGSAGGAKILSHADRRRMTHPAASMPTPAGV